MKKILKNTVTYRLFCRRRSFFALLSVFLLLFPNITLSASPGEGLVQKEAKITIKQKNVTISKVLDEIGQQTGYSIIVRDNDVNTREKITIDETDKSLEQVLAVLFKGKDITYEIRENTISIFKPDVRYAEVAQQQTRPLTGTVKDKHGEPLIGANVKVKGGEVIGTITDTDGNYSLANVPAGSVLKFSYVGMISKEMKFGNQSVLNVVLEEDAVGLDEVVVIGYMAQRKGLLTGSVATMKVDENITALPTTSAGNILVGKLSGVNVGTASAIPGSNPGINIRTSSSWKDDDNRPIQPVTYVIDGVVRGSGDFNNLSPNEIDDITVLKDAASAAIYGSRSAGGVIIVTTKRGNRGKPTFNYSYGFSVDSRTKNSDLTSAVQAGEMYTRINGSADPAGWAWSQDEIDHYRTINNGWGYDQLETVWRNPTTQTHNLSVNGGGERVRYFGAASYVKQEGFLKPLSYDKYNVRINVTADITDNFEVFAGFALYDNYTGNAVFEDAGSNYSKLRIWQPDQPIYTDKGQYVDYGWIANMGAAVDGRGGYNKSQMLKPQAIFSATYKAPFLKGLSAKVTYSKSWTNDITKKYYTNYDLATMKRSGTNGRIISTNDNDIVNMRKSNWVGKDYIERKSSWSDDKQFNFQLNYQNIFKNVHRVSAAFITEWYEGGGASVTGGRETFPIYTTDQFWAASGARADTWGNGDKDWKEGRMSYIGQFSYSYADKYLLNFSFREDGSMNFAPDQRWGFFPAASIGWVMSEEDFFKRSAIQFLKLRASVGLTGDDSVGGWQWQESYKADSKYAYFGETPSQSVGITYGSVVNPNLTWEKSLSYNVGVDVNFLNSWNLSVDYWYRNTYDILSRRSVSLPTTFSLSMPEENYGKMRAQGFDFQLGYNGKSRNFSYFGNLTMSYGWNKVTKQDYAENAQWIDIAQGKSHKNNRITGYEFEQILRTQEQLDAFIAANPNYRHQGLSPQLGMMVYKDLSGPNGEPDGVIDAWDRVLLRAKNFPIVYGLNLGGSWKGLSVDMMLSGKLGESKSMRDLAGGVEWNRMWNQWYYDSWTPETMNATLPKRVSNNATSTHRDTESKFWVKDASFMRLKYLTVSYDLPKGPFYNKVFDNVRLFVTGTNLFVLSNFNKNYYDPEIGNGNAFPVLRSWNFGINVKF